MNKNKISVLALLLVVAIAIFLFLNFYQKDNLNDKEDAEIPYSDDQSEEGSSDYVSYDQKIPTELLQNLVEKRKSMHSSVYEAVVYNYGKDDNSIDANNIKVLWDDYNNFGFYDKNGLFLGVNKGILYMNSGEGNTPRFSLSDDPDGWMRSLIISDFIFDNLIFELSEDINNGTFWGEEEVNGIKCYIFQKEYFFENFDSMNVKKFWISDADGSIKKVQIENRLGISSPDVETEKIDIFINSVSFSEDRQIAPVNFIIEDKPDTDQDGLIDEVENDIFNTDYNNPDSDGDGYSDGSEIDFGYDPNIKSPEDKLF